MNWAACKKALENLLSLFSEEDSQKLEDCFRRSLIWQLVPYILLVLVMQMAYLLLVGQNTMVGHPFHLLVLSLAQTDASVSAVACALENACEYSHRRIRYYADSVPYESCNTAKAQFIILAIVGTIESVLLARMFIILDNDRVVPILIGAVSSLLLMSIVAFMEAHHEIKINRQSEDG